MAENAISAHCPHCGAAALHALLPVPKAVERTSTSPIAAVISADGLGSPSYAACAEQRVVCSDCQRPWSAAIIPWEHLRQLQTAAESLAEAKRQIAMLRLIMSKDQLDRAEKSRRDVIKLFEAA